LSGKIDSLSPPPLAETGLEQQGADCGEQ